MKNAFALVLATVMGLMGCRNGNREAATAAPSKPAEVKPPAHSDEAEHEELPKRVRLPKEVIADAKIKTAPAVKEALAATTSLPGEITADPDKSARVSTPVAGRLADLRFKEGSVVKKGDVLALVRVPEIGQVRAGYNATRAKAASARANAERLATLGAKRVMD